MPIFRAHDKLVLYAHVPKCGGMAVFWYLTERFGKVAFHDNRHMRRDQSERWSRTSPQHVDRDSLGRLFPDGFFDAAFTIVRHPVDRIVSAFHFQRELELSIPAETSFSEWLQDLPDRMKEDPFVFDNHVRPMDDIVPDGAAVFHMEHGLDALVPWCDALTGACDGPRAVPRINERGDYAKVRTEVTRPDARDMELIGQIYGRDFARFGYAPDRKAPEAPAPDLSKAQRAERDVALKRLESPMGRLTRRVRRRLRT